MTNVYGIVYTHEEISKLATRLIGYEVNSDYDDEYDWNFIRYGGEHCGWKEDRDIIKTLREHFNEIDELYGVYPSYREIIVLYYK